MRFLLIVFLPMTFLAAQENDTDSKLLMVRPETQELLSMLADPVIAREVGFDQKQLHLVRKERIADARDASARIRDIGKKLMSTMSSGTLTEQELLKAELGLASEIVQSNYNSDTTVDELLSPTQLKRLLQVSVRAEIAKYGYSFALGKGKLGRAIEVHEGDNVKLEARIRRIEESARLKIEKILGEMETEVLDELTDEQRSKAKELLGKPFYHNTMSEMEVMAKTVAPVSKRLK